MHSLIIFLFVVLQFFVDKIKKAKTSCETD